jgi:hypothetical protein
VSDGRAWRAITPAVATLAEANDPSPVWHIIRTHYMHIAWTYCHRSANIENTEEVVVRWETAPATCIACIAAAWDLLP